MHLSPDCTNQNVRLYIEVVDGIGGKQIDLLLENQVVEKPLEKLWNEKCHFEEFVFFLDALSATVFSTEDKYSTVIDIL